MSSAVLRQRIRLATARLQKHLDGRKTYSSEIDHDKSDKENLLDLKGLANELIYEIEALEAAVAVIYETHQHWFDMIERAKEPAATAERTRNEEFNEETKYIELLDQGNDAVDELKKQRVVFEKTISMLQMNIEEQDTANGAVRMPLELPKVELPVFDGDVLKFEEFWDFYENTVHVNSQMSDRLKLSYLRRSLKGVAKQAIEGYRDTDENYPIVVKLLKQQFGNPEAIVQALYRELRQLRSPNDSAPSLRTFVHSVERILRQLENQKESVENAQIRDIIDGKLPKSVLEEVLLAKKAATKWTTDELRKKPQSIMELREKIDRTHGDRKYASPRDEARTNDNAKMRPSAAFAARMRQRNGKCSLCDGEHWTTDCPEYKTLDVREARIKELKLCQMCLRKGHVKRDRGFTKPCYYCKSPDHNQVLCPKRHQAAAFAAVAETEADLGFEPSSDPVWIRTNSGKISAVNAAMKAHTDETLLLMKRAAVYDPVMKRGLVNKAIFFDNGSQKSLISKKLAKELQLTDVGEAKIMMSTLGDRKPKVFNAPIYEIMLKFSSGGAKVMKVYGVDYIMDESPVISVKPITQPDPDGKRWFMKWSTAEADLLIGGDHHWDFDIKQVYKLKEGTRLIQSKLGYMAAGPIPAELKPYRKPAAKINAQVTKCNLLVCKTCAVSKQKDSDCDDITNFVGIKLDDPQLLFFQATPQCDDARLYFNGGRQTRLEWSTSSAQTVVSFLGGYNMANSKHILAFCVCRPLRLSSHFQGNKQNHQNSRRPAPAFEPGFTLIVGDGGGSSRKINIDFTEVNDNVIVPGFSVSKVNCDVTVQLAFGELFVEHTKVDADKVYRKRFE